MGHEARTTTAAPRSHALAHVEALQRDGLLLLAHLAEAPSGRLNGGVADPRDAVDPDLFITDPDVIATHPAKLGQLLKAVGLLGRAAAPATVNSIRLTNAYIDRTNSLPGPDVEVGPPAADAARRAERLRKWIRRTRYSTFFAVLIVLGLLMHVDDGRRFVAQHLAVQADIGRSYAALAKLDREKDFEPQVLPAGERAPEPWPKLSTLEMCWPTEHGGADEHGKPEYFLAPLKPTAQDACTLLSQQKLREQIVFSRLEAWNCVTRLFNPYHFLRWIFSKPVCEDSPADLRRPATVGDWRRTELRTQDGITQITGYFLPLLLGGIGGSISVLRGIEAKLRSRTLSAHDGVIGIGRILLASIFGGLLGLVFGTNGDVQLGAFSLSLAAWAFFLGYALEGALKALDALIENALGRLPPEDTKPAGLIP